MGSANRAVATLLRVRSPGLAPPVLAAGLATAAALAAMAAADAGSAARRVVGLGWPIACTALALAGVRWSVARKTSTMRRDFAVGVSHDLRTPLAQIQMFTEMLLLRRDRTEEERSRWLRIVERESHALGGLVDNLVLLAQSPDGRAFPARETLDLGSLVEDVAAAFASRAATRGMRIVADPPADVLVEADPRALRQMVTNLVDNALRFGPDGQSIALSVRAGSGVAELAVEDQGPGLRGRERARFLRPSGHLERWIGSNGGGLGLAVVAEVVRAHGGRAAVDEPPGGGARVRILLPLAAPAVRG